MHTWQGIASNVLILLPYQLGYLKDSNAAAHSVDTDISEAVIHLSYFMLESVNYYQSMERTRGNVV